MDVNHEWVDFIFKNVITRLDCATEVLMKPFRTILQSGEGGLFHHLNQNILVFTQRIKMCTVKLANHYQVTKSRLGNAGFGISFVITAYIKAIKIVTSQL